MFNKSIAIRLFWIISTALVLAFVAIVLVYYILSYRIIKTSLEEKAIKYENEVVVRKVQRQLVVTNEVAKNVGNQIPFYICHGGGAQLLTGIMHEYHFLNAIHVRFDSPLKDTNVNNLVVHKEQDSIIYEEKYLKEPKQIINGHKYTSPSENVPAAWSEMFFCERNGERVVSYRMPFYEEKTGNRMGEIFCELSLKALNEEVQSLEIEDGGYVVIAARDGKYISHPVKYRLENKTIRDIDFQVAYEGQRIGADSVLQNDRSGTVIVYPDYRNGKKYWAYYSKIEGIDWTFFLALPYNNLFNPLTKSMFVLTGLSVLGILAIFLIVWVTTKRILYPLSKVAMELKVFGAQTNELNVKTTDEVELLSETLRFMKNWYERFKLRRSFEDRKNMRRMEDLLEASEIQKSLIKTDFSVFNKIPEIDFHAIYKPANVVSGDLMDYFFIDANRLLISIGDVSGKGIPAAMFMGVAQTYIKNHSVLNDPSLIVSRVNSDLHSSNRQMFFLTLWIGILDIKSGELVYCNAAHLDPIILKGNARIKVLKGTNGLPLGLYPDKKYSNSVTNLEKGDTLLLYTDGITDLLDEGGEAFGEKRLKVNIKNLAGSPPATIVKKIVKSLDIFKGNSNQTDDLTLMALSYNGEGNKGNVLNES